MSSQNVPEEANDNDRFDHTLLRATKLHANRFTHARLRNYNLPVIINTNLEAVADAKIKWNQQVQQETKELKDLNEAEEKQIAELQRKLESLKQSANPSQRKANITHLRAVRAANEVAFDNVYYTPSASSPLNHIFAVRNVTRVITQTRQAIAYQRQSLTELIQTIREDEGFATSAEEATVALQARVDELEISTASQRDDVDEARREKEAEAKMLKEMEASIKDMENKSRVMMRELQRFVEEQLAAMIAVEEMGGTVVGEEVDTKVLHGIVDGEVGLDGKVKGKGGKGKKALLRGQKRIDEIWGKKSREEEDEEGNEEQEDDDDGEPVDPVQAAGKEVIDLIETLMNAALSPSSSSYTTLPRDSAAARFLVRSFVATLHPTNALKIRLIEFGRGIEDG